MDRSGTVGRVISQNRDRSSSGVHVTPEDIVKGAKARAGGGIVCVVKRSRW